MKKKGKNEGGEGLTGEFHHGKAPGAQREGRPVATGRKALVTATGKEEFAQKKGYKETLWETTAEEGKRLKAIKKFLHEKRIDFVGEILVLVQKEKKHIKKTPILISLKKRRLHLIEKKQFSACPEEGETTKLSWGGRNGYTLWELPRKTIRKVLFSDTPGNHFEPLFGPRTLKEEGIEKALHKKLNTPLRKMVYRRNL